MNATSDEQALLAAIVANPADDTARLVYADCLDELGDERVTCPKCKGKRKVFLHAAGAGGVWRKCDRCDGAGTVIDTSRTDRAAFIRCQIESARVRATCDPQCRRRSQQTDRCGSYIDPKTCKSFPCVDCWRHLKDRESDLLARHRARWLPVCPACQGSGRMTPVDTGLEGIAVSIQGSCSHCKGTGHVGDMRCGFLERVEVPTLDCVLEACTEDDGPLLPTGDQRIRVYNGKYAPTDFARTLFRGEWATVQAIVARDREPFKVRSRWSWWEESRHATHGILPTIVFEVLWRNHPEFRQQDSMGRWLEFPTAEAAKQALALALTDTLRALCGGET